jgi:hypothetical protein
MLCPNCSTPVTSQESFCGECGHDLRSAHPPAAQPAPQNIAQPSPPPPLQTSTPPPATQVDFPPAQSPQPKRKRRVWLIVLIVLVVVLMISCCLVQFFGDDTLFWDLMWEMDII